MKYGNAKSLLRLAITAAATNQIYTVHHLISGITSMCGLVVVDCD